MSRSSFGMSPCRICRRMTTSAGFARHAHESMHASMGHYEDSGKRNYGAVIWQTSAAGSVLIRQAAVVSQQVNSIYGKPAHGYSLTVHGAERFAEFGRLERIRQSYLASGGPVHEYIWTWRAAGSNNVQDLFRVDTPQPSWSTQATLAAISLISHLCANL